VKFNGLLTSADLYVPFTVKLTGGDGESPPAVETPSEPRNPLPLAPPPALYDKGSEGVKDVKLDANGTDQEVAAEEEVYSALASPDDGVAKTFPAPRRKIATPKKSCLKEVGSLTDVCYHDNVAEVDLISLIEEQIPRYVLRVDTLTDFAGYDNSDWIQTPCLPPDTELELTPELIEETLKYFSEYSVLNTSKYLFCRSSADRTLANIFYDKSDGS